TGGVEIGARWRQWLLAWRFRDLQLAITPAVSARSRILWHRRVVERCRRIAPFLSYDGADPYPVLTDGGRIVWMLDIFSTSTAYPYAQRWSLLSEDNYIRHAATATVDAYDGTVRFYLADAADPLTQVYTRIFPGLFLPRAEMPPDLRRHTRYPAFLLALQAAIWGRYAAASSDVTALPDLLSGIAAWELFNVSYAVRPGDAAKRNVQRASPDLVTIASLARRAVPGSTGPPAQIAALLLAGSDPVDDPPPQTAGADHHLWQWQPQTPFTVPETLPLRINASVDSPPPALLSVAPIAGGIVYVHGSTPVATAGNSQSLSKTFGFDNGSARASGTSLEAMLDQLAPALPLSPRPTSARQYSNGPGTAPAGHDALAAARQRYRAMQQAKQRQDWAAYGEAERRLGEILGIVQ
ncbi:MAG TPA: UPF0182 family protein, partial [Abditibacteriaceae bacterium]|nr:UPF0182 family protein [Abditibacteriaceae bacterium]